MSCRDELNNSSDVDIQEGSVEDIAKLIFSNPPQETGRYNLIPPESNFSIIFEILITFLMEGVMIHFNNLEDIDIDSVDSNVILQKLQDLDDWVNSINFCLFVDKLDINSNISDRYCKVLLKNSYEKPYFTFKGIEEEFTFLLNGNEVEREDVRDYYAILPIGNYYYKISFLYIPQLKMTQN